MLRWLSQVLFVTLICPGIRTASSQYSLFSQFYNAPLLINPAYTGLIDQDYRVQMIYRDQWRQLVPFKTLGVSADITLPSYTGRRRQLAAGLVFMRDQMGEFQVSNTFILSGSYQYMPDPAGRHKIALGIQGGYVQKLLDYDGLYFENQIGDDHKVDTGIISGEQLMSNRIGYMTANAGLAYTFYISRKRQFRTGASIFNLTHPKEQFLAGNDHEAGKLRQRMLATVGATYWLSAHLYIFPEILFVHQQGMSEVNAGSGVGYLLHKEGQDNIGLLAGGWYRTNGAAIVMLGINYKNMSVMFTCDQIVSDMKELKSSPSVSGRAVAAYEVSLIYKGFLNRAIPFSYTLPCGIF